MHESIKRDQIGAFAQSEIELFISCHA